MIVRQLILPKMSDRKKDKRCKWWKPQRYVNVYQHLTKQF